MYFHIIQNVLNNDVGTYMGCHTCTPDILPVITYSLYLMSDAYSKKKIEYRENIMMMKYEIKDHIKLCIIPNTYYIDVSMFPFVLYILIKDYRHPANYGSMYYKNTHS